MDVKTDGLSTFMEQRSDGALRVDEHQTRSSKKASKNLIWVENLSVPFDRRVWLQAQALNEANCDVSVICPKGISCDKRFREVICGIKIYRFWSFEASSSLLGYFFEYSIAMLQMFAITVILLITKGFDTIQLCNPPDFLFLIALPFKLLGKKIIFDQHDLVPELYKAKKNCTKYGIMVKLLHHCERLAFRFADVAIVANESFKNRALALHATNEHKVMVVRYGPELKDFKISMNNHKYRNGKKFLLFYVGALNYQDGGDYLLRSIQQLDKMRNDFALIIIGTGTELKQLKAFTDTLGLREVITFTGQMPYNEMIPILCTADVCLSPEPKSVLNDSSTMLKVLDYMAASKPIVAFDLVETRISAGEAAIYAKANYEKDFALKISKLLESEIIRKAMGEVAYQRIKQCYSWDHSIPQLLAAYSKLTAI